MIFSDITKKPITVQGIELEEVDKYKYPGVWISEGWHCLKEHERHLTAKSKCYAGIMKHKALWNFDRAGSKGNMERCDGPRLECGVMYALGGTE